MADRNWITREEIAEIHEAIATRQPARTAEEQEHQRQHMLMAKEIRQIERVGGTLVHLYLRYDKTNRA